MHFTPAGSSWISQVIVGDRTKTDLDYRAGDGDDWFERWFGSLTDQMLTRGTHRSVHALEKDIRA